MFKLLVIADDLTGANDTGAQFAKQDISVFVVTEPGAKFAGSVNEYQVLVVNTESRHVDPSEAAARVRSAVKDGGAAGVGWFYKKTDSTLRGNVGSELEALLSASKRRILPFAPAFPKQQRTTQDGFQYVGDELIHETAFARDSLNPITESYIPAIINKQTRIQTRVVRVSDLSQSGSVEFLGSGIYVFDATSDDELRRVGELLKNKHLLEVLAGSAGFAEHLPDLLDFERSPFATRRFRTGMIVVNGSLNEVSLAQIRRAEQSGFAAVTLPPEILLREDGAETAEADQVIAEIVGLDLHGREVILRSIKSDEDLQYYLSLAERFGIDPQQLSLRIAESTAKVVKKVLERTSFRLLTVFGGDTLVALARALKWRGLLPRGEVLPGITFSEVAGQEGELCLITKAGGFGSEDVLQQIKGELGGFAAES
jgi:D-threonate/D-erythronate kinase